MVWSPPMTAVVGAVLTAAQWNQYVRDLFSETSPAKVTAANQITVSTAANAIAARTPGGAEVTTSQSTTSTSYADLATAGPAYTVTTGTTATVFFRAFMDNTTNGAAAAASVAVSGATTVSASDNWSMWCEHDSSNLDSMSFESFHRFTGLTAGSNTFTMKYRVASGTGNFSKREIFVLPF